MGINTRVHFIFSHYKIEFTYHTWGLQCVWFWVQWGSDVQLALQQGSWVVYSDPLPSPPSPTYYFLQIPPQAMVKGPVMACWKGTDTTPLPKPETWEHPSVTFLSLSVLSQSPGLVHLISKISLELSPYLILTVSHFLNPGYYDVLPDCWISPGANLSAPMGVPL